MRNLTFRMSAVEMTAIAVIREHLRRKRGNDRTPSMSEVVRMAIRQVARKVMKGENDRGKGQRDNGATAGPTG